VSSFQIPVPKESIGFQFWKLHNFWQKKISTALQPYKITHTQFVILASIKWFQEQSEDPSQRQISSLTGIDKMTLSKAIRRLEELKLVNRIKSKNDTRAILVSLSNNGQEIMPKLVNLVEKIDAEVFGVVENDEKKKLNTILFKISQSVGL